MRVTGIIASLIGVLATLSLVGPKASAQSLASGCVTVPPPCATAPAPTEAPGLVAPPAQEPTLSPEAFAATGGGESFAAATPQVIGDLLGYYTTITTTSSVTLNTLTFGPATLNQSSTVLIPALARGAFKITENESPQPRDRVFLTYNYFHVPLQLPSTTSSTFNTSFLGTPFSTPLGVNAVNYTQAQLNVNRETLGFERTFLDDRQVSFGMRLPLFQSGSTLSGSLNPAATAGFINLTPPATSVNNNLVRPTSVM